MDVLYQYLGGVFLELRLPIIELLNVAVVENAFFGQYRHENTFVF